MKKKQQHVPLFQWIHMHKIRYCFLSPLWLDLRTPGYCTISAQRWTLLPANDSASMGLCSREVSAASRSNLRAGESLSLQNELPRAPDSTPGQSARLTTLFASRESPSPCRMSSRVYNYIYNIKFLCMINIMIVTIKLWFIKRLHEELSLSKLNDYQPTYRCVSNWVLGLH